MTTDQEHQVLRNRAKQVAWRQRLAEKVRNGDLEAFHKRRKSTPYGRAWVELQKKLDRGTSAQDWLATEAERKLRGNAKKTGAGKHKYPDCPYTPGTPEYQKWRKQKLQEITSTHDILLTT
jgi:hypothetical protein